MYLLYIPMVSLNHCGWDDPSDSVESFYWGAMTILTKVYNCYLAYPLASEIHINKSVLMNGSTDSSTYQVQMPERRHRDFIAREDNPLGHGNTIVSNAVMALVLFINSLSRSC